MLAVHGFWSIGLGLGVWAEDSARPVKSPSQAARSVRPHPFALPAEALAEIYAGKPDQATLLLPSLLTAPLDSPEVVRLYPRPAPRTMPVLSAWSAPVVRLDPLSAADMLAAEPIEDVRHGASLRALAGVAAFATDLVERGRFLPALHLGPAVATALWRPVLQGPDVARLQALVAALPPVARAELLPGGEVSGAELVADALRAFLDAAVRDRLTAAGATPAGSARRTVDLLPRRPGRRPRQPPAVEAWLGALTAGSGELTIAPAEAEGLAGLLAPWDEVGTGRPGPARATFRLVEPGHDGSAAGWRVEFGLQSMDDPSLLVQAQLAWDSGAALGRWLDRPAELLLAELGRAARVYPALVAALRQARPCALELDDDGVHEFLCTAADALDAGGFGVLLPSWWSQRRRLGVKLSASGTGTDGVVTSAGLGRDQLMQFDWRLALGDEALTEDEIEALAATKAPLVRMRGQWVVVDREQLRRGLEFLRSAAPSEGTVADVLALAARHPDAGPAPLPLLGVSADGLLGDLLSGAAERTLEPVPAPPGFTADLRPYQNRGLSWLAFLSSLRLGACLADDMGLGKTVQLLALEAHERAGGPIAPSLLLCPMSLVGNWQREAARFAPALRVYVHHGPDRLRGAALAEGLAGVDLVVSTYATATRDIEALAPVAWHRLVLDEAQAVKNNLSRTTQAVRRLAGTHRVALTGTPVENRLAELWSVMDFCNPGILGSPEEFRTRYAIPVERLGETEPAQRLRAVTRPYVLRRLKTDPRIIDDLPEKIEIRQDCYLTPEQASIYRAVVEEMMGRIEGSTGIERRGNVLAAMTKLKQVCNHPAHVLHDRSAIGRRSGKVTRIEELLAEIVDAGDRALCFTQFTGFAELMVPHFATRLGCEVFYLHGGTARARREEIVEAFQNGTGPAVFVLSLKAGGTGLNLTRANHVIHMDRWWNPAVENQASDRAFRIGQTRTVTVHKLVCVGTLEERIDALIERKKALAELVVSDGEGWLTELSTDALREVFALSEEALGEQ